MRRRRSVVDTIAMLLFSFGVLGTWIAGFVGAVVGLAIGAVLGIACWKNRHIHEWNRGAVYNRRGQPYFMVKFCECGEIEFDGYIEGDR